MNANFRRDYSYKADNDFHGVEEGEFLRYLKYDRETRSYLFLTGEYTNKKEKLIVVPFSKLPEARAAFKKIYRIDYYPTNEYQGDFGKLITKSSQLEVGKAYKFNKGTKFINNTESLKLTRFAKHFGTEKAYFDLTASDREYKDFQICHLSWLDDGHLTARAVG